MKGRSLILVCILLFLTASLRARTITVDDDAPAEFNNIQSAIDAASNGDTVLVADGIYTGTGNRDINFRGKAITVRSESGPESCIIDCNGNQSDPHRGFIFDWVDVNNPMLDGFTIINGHGPDEHYEHNWHSLGGAILCNGNSPTIMNCIISNNRAWGGGDKGEGQGCGGGIWCQYASPTITNCIISDNSGQYNGGGIYTVGCSPIINNCTIADNSVGLCYGGGIYNVGNLIIKDCIISGNMTSDWGLGYGGGIALAGNGVFVKIDNCIVTGNSARYSGGGIVRWSNGVVVINNSTIFGNSAGNSGGGIYLCDSTLILDSSILWNNIAPYGSELALKTNYIHNPPPNSKLTASYCDIRGGQAQVHVDPNCTFIWGLGNIDVDPCFVDPCNGDYYLKSEGWRWDMQREIWTWDDVTSRCIDAGDPGMPLGEEPLSIPDDPNHLYGENLRINMGAYGGTAKASMPPYDWTLNADLTNDGTVNFEDYAGLTNGACMSIYQPGDRIRYYKDASIVVDAITLMSEDWLKQTSWYAP